jgi:hypothetical protein
MDRLPGAGRTDADTTITPSSRQVRCHPSRFANEGLTMTTMPLRVTAGVDRHLDVQVAAALDETGALLGVEWFDTRRRGYRRLLGWLRCFGEVELIGVEGTGSYGAGLTRHLLGEGMRVVDVDRPIANAAAGGGRATPKTRSPRRALRSRVTRPARPRPETETLKRCGFSAWRVARLAKPELRR